MVTEDGRSDRDRRQALIRAAFRCIAEKGFEGLRLREVAFQVGIDHSTLHHYFPTKQDLVAGVVEHATRQFWATMPPEGSPGERLHRHLATLAGMIQEKPALFIVLGELDLRAHRDPTVRAVVERQEQGWRTALTDVLSQGAEVGAWTEDLDQATAVELIIAVVKGIRLLPDLADHVLHHLERLLVAERSDEPIPTPAGGGEA